MQQYFAKNESLELKDADYHHIKNVMRMKKGELVRVAYDENVYLCEISDMEKSVRLSVLEKLPAVNGLSNVTVCFALIKEQRLDYLLQKSTEAGATSFIPLVTKRTVVKVDEKKASNKLQRWQKICKEAAEQAYRTSVPVVQAISDLKKIITTDYDVKLLCSLNENTQNIKKVIPKINKYDKILIVVGPEGGFEKDEEKFLTENGFISVSLGENVLRAETAPVVALSMINYEFMR